MSVNSEQKYLTIRFIHRLVSNEKDPYRCAQYKISLSKLVTMINKSSLMPDPKIVCNWISENNIGVVRYDTISLNHLIVMDYFTNYKLKKKPIRDMEKISAEYFKHIEKRNKEWDRQDRILAKELKQKELDDKFVEY